jgi:hypothetical protein
MISVCLLCTTEHKNYNTLSCGHTFGSECITKHILEIAKKSKDGTIACPAENCLNVLDNEAIASLLSAVDLESYHILLIENNSGQRRDSASKPDCIIKEKEYVLCECGIKLCGKCFCEWRESHNCSFIVSNIKVESIVLYERIMCPKCSNNVIKHGCCNLLTCSKCKQKYCYACGAEFNLRHYSGFFQCQGIKSTLSLKIYILLNALLALTFPISIIVIGIMFLVSMVRKIFELQIGKKKQVLILVGVILGSLILGPLAISLLMLPYLIVLLIRIVVFCKRTAKRKLLIQQ